MTRKLTTKQMESRDYRIRKMYSTGKYSVRSLANRIGLSKTRVHEIIAY